MNQKFILAIVVFLSFFSFTTAPNKNWNQELAESLNQYIDCKKENPESLACNKFTGQALASVYKVNDFYSQAIGRYMTNSEISKFVMNSDKWSLIGHAYEQETLNEAQKLANTNKAVVAVYLGEDDLGHVAIILPGEVKTSGTWGFSVPNSVSFFAHEPENSYVGKGLSYAFERSMIRHVSLFARK